MSLRLQPSFGHSLLIFDFYIFQRLRRKGKWCRSFLSMTVRSNIHLRYKRLVDERFLKTLGVLIMDDVKVPINVGTRLVGL